MTLPSGARPTAILLTDLDANGRLDVALADGGNDEVLVLSGGGDGTFGFPIEIPLAAGAEPVALAFGDFDQDGRLDLVAADRGTSDVSFLKGTVGSFFVADTLALLPGAQASGIVAADFDDDGRMDIAVSNKALGSVSVALGLGDGTFKPLQTFSVGAGSRPSSIVVADFDRDGWLDLATASSTHGEVAVLLGVGDGTFSPATAFPVHAGANLTALATADVDRDGSLDVVVADRSAGAAAVLFGNGGGAFGAPVAFGAGPGPSSVAIADVDHDGNLDLALAVTGTGSASLLVGHGDGTFDPGFLFGTAGTGTRSLAIGDVDQDGDRDVVVADETSGSVGVLLQR